MSWFLWISPLNFHFCFVLSRSAFCSPGQLHLPTRAPNVPLTQTQSFIVLVTRRETIFRSYWCCLIKSGWKPIYSAEEKRPPPTYGRKVYFPKPTYTYTLFLSFNVANLKSDHSLIIVHACFYVTILVSVIIQTEQMVNKQ